MPLTRDNEPWALALWVEKHHGEGGARFILNQQGQMVERGDRRGLAMWEEVGRCFEAVWNARGRLQ